jgi:hypothetical protein
VEEDPTVSAVEGFAAAEEVDPTDPDAEWLATTVAGAGATSATGTPHCPRGLLPGNLSRTPEICSSTAEGMLQEVLGSLSPTIKPGHLYITLSPELQLSMIS